MSDSTCQVLLDAENFVIGSGSRSCESSIGIAVALC